MKITEAGRRALFELQYCGPASGMIDSLDEAKAAFRAPSERPLSAAAFAASYAQMQRDRPARDK